MTGLSKWRKYSAWQSWRGWKHAITLTIMVAHPATPFSCFNARNLVWLAAWHTITTSSLPFHPINTTIFQQRMIKKLNYWHFPLAFNALHQIFQQKKIGVSNWWQHFNSKWTSTTVLLATKISEDDGEKLAKKLRQFDWMMEMMKIQHWLNAEKRERNSSI